MGEEGETIKFYSAHDTFFFWNMDDYPVPVGTDLSYVFSSIGEALHLMGFKGTESIHVVCKQLKKDVLELFKAQGVVYLPKSTQTYYKSDSVPSLDITLYMILLAKASTPRPDIAVLAKPNEELRRVLQCLKSRDYNVLLVEPPPDEEYCLFSVDYLLENARLFGGGKPRLKQVLTAEDERLAYDWDYHTYWDPVDDVSHLSNNNMLDFTEPIRHVKGMTRTVIFWDAVDCPFPLSFSPDEIFAKIKSVLSDIGLSDNITIWAYVDDYKEGSPYKHLGDNSRIYFLPGGDEGMKPHRDVSEC